MTTISANTFNFLQQLVINNDREWFQENKELYLTAKDDVETFAEAIINEFRKINPHVSPDLTGKKSVKRIYRDVRFSKNKAPYKSNFGISISTSLKGIHGPGYFVQLQPGRSFVAGGMWMPEAPHLKLIRQEIDYNGSHLLEILSDKDFKAFFKEGLQQTDKLKTTPKNYEADHANIELLKLKSFTVSSAFTDRQLQTEGIVEKVVEALKQIMPLNNFLQEAIASQ